MATAYCTACDTGQYYYNKRGTKIKEVPCEKCGKTALVAGVTEILRDDPDGNFRTRIVRRGTPKMTLGDKL